MAPGRSLLRFRGIAALPCPIAEVLRHMTMPVAGNYMPYRAGIAGALAEQIRLRACLHGVDQCCVTFARRRANGGRGVSAMGSVDLRVARVEIDVGGRAFERRPEARGVERANSMLAPRVEVRDVVLRGPRS